MKLKLTSNKIEDYENVSADDILKDKEETECKEIRVDDVRDKLENVYAKGYELGEKSYLKKLDGIFSWRKGFLYCFSGYPQSGKSEFINYAMLLRAKKYKDKIVMYSPETDTVELIMNLVRSYLNKNVNPLFDNLCTKKDFNKGLDFVNKYFIFLENEDNLQSETSILNKFKKLQETGYNCFVIDPLNWLLDQSGTSDKNIFLYLKKTLSDLKMFAKNSNSIVCYVEHPKAPMYIYRKDGNYKIQKASQHTIAGGSMHYNKVDCMVILHRLYEEDIEERLSSGQLLQKTLSKSKNNINFVEFETVKMKSQRLNGKQGSVLLNYDFVTGRFK